MSALREELVVGWQSRVGAIVGACTAIVGLALGAGAFGGPMVAMMVLLALALAVMSRVQWAVLDGPTVTLRDATTGYAFRVLPARQVASVRYHRIVLPWCRLRLEREAAGVGLVLMGPSPSHPTVRAVALWLIVHGRRRTRIDTSLLDALAGMPEHGPTRQPHDASPA
ncbi:hypothetical protein DWG18_01675 [Lysobacter sp. TY2-98]|uniref:hypothetical protein n=1 Tax=Lysobacter sp. TY2-98 TaxID=2290922 RepID=UPI000E202406|nr:hypothetical protein [Lysobacter sp. TY2-98]AXK71123.1 hypothetical protein DWG18_01675 [Lysobacter sp. TY2-98]